MSDTIPLVESTTTSSASTLLLFGTVFIIAVSGIVWLVLQKQSAAISTKNLALASGTSVAALQSSKKRNNTVLITGPMGAGKTALWCYVRFPENKAAPKTQTSMAVNSAEVKVGDTDICLVDVPGHQKHRFDRDAFLPVARGIVFVVDSVAVSQNLTSTTELLYDVLANKHVQQKETPVLILCNKQDDPSALSNLRIKSMLEEEINRLRASRQADLGSLRNVGAVSGAGNNDDDDDEAAAEKASDFLGYDGKRFSFEDLPNAVQINESSMAMNMDIGGTEQINSWIIELFN
ncbi:hypothetical protein H4R99_005567 [Coemansia sp. RSA 1722]|nr:hypothetical protein IWW45_007748 [Coemansia sp. RSA 485]KAJ2594897.1 hypothetical protein H4R99_005567 [Coemansia sp. RSA 1722]KAJ2600308.1 hypothetical protein GGF39_001850 [Coemansia sp. RSA 1721]